MLLAHLPVTAATGLPCALLLTAQMVAASAAGAAQNAGPAPPAVPESTMSTRTSLQLAQSLTNLTVDYMASEYVNLDH